MRSSNIIRDFNNQANDHRLQNVKSIIRSQNEMIFMPSKDTKQIFLWDSFSCIGSIKYLNDFKAIREVEIKHRLKYFRNNIYP